MKFSTLILRIFHGVKIEELTIKEIRNPSKSAMKTSRIFLSPPHMGGGEQEFVRQAFESNYIAPLGEHVDAFEQELCRVTGAAHAAVLSSGTAAIHLALIILGVKPGDVVLCQSFTFAGSANPILYLGAEPVFIDSEPETWNMDPELLKKAVMDCLSEGRKPGAIIPVHLYGMPAKMREIMEIAREFDIPVIEDAAEALGSSLNGKSCGNLGDIGILSFNGNKIITTSGGGALLSNNPEIVEKARFLSTQARDPAPHYQHSQVGYNYRLSNVLAAIGRGQLRVLDDRVSRKREIFGYYSHALKDVPGVEFMPEPEWSRSTRWLSVILIDPREFGADRENVRLALEKENIESRPVWKPMHLQPVFQEARIYNNGVSEALFEKGLCLPSGTAMSDEDLERVCRLVNEAVNR